MTAPGIFFAGDNKLKIEVNEAPGLISCRGMRRTVVKDRSPVHLPGSFHFGFRKWTSHSVFTGTHLNIYGFTFLFERPQFLVGLKYKNNIFHYEEG